MNLKDLKIRAELIAKTDRFREDGYEGFNMAEAMPRLTSNKDTDKFK